jgi:hypothetical protein
MLIPLRRNGTCLIKKKKNWKKKPSCDNCFKHAKEHLKHHQFASIFEQRNFTDNGILKGRENKNSIYDAPFVIFQKQTIIVLSRCDTPCGSF